MAPSTAAALLLLLLPASLAQLSVVDTAIADSRFTTLVAALQKANLVSALNGTGPFTVFAPTNDAFAAYLSSKNMTADQLLNRTDLAGILQFHVISGKTMSSQLQATQEAVTLQGMKLVITRAGPAVKVGPVDRAGPIDVTFADINCTNGVIHVLNNVLWPPSIVDVAVGNAKFTTLVAALTTANLATTLGTQGPFTVFAPTDAAFAAFLTASNLTSQQLLARADLADILKYHVVSGRILSSQLQATQDVTTLQGTKVTVTKTGSAVKVGPTANVTTADIAGFNGIIHAIDGVLIPPSPSVSTTGSPSARVSYGVGLGSYLPSLAVVATVLLAALPAGAFFAA